MSKVALIFIGSLNTDIVATGLEHFPGPGKDAFGNDLIFGAGGKSRNMADMAARLTEKGMVAMLGRTTQDTYGMWKLPLDALRRSGVNTDYIVIDQTSEKLPGIALITVDQAGNNRIVVLPGISDDFSKEDIDKADVLFTEVAANNGYVGLTLEAPIETMRYAVERARAHSLKIIFDPGGIPEGTKLGSLLEGVFLIKPNEHEVKTITGVTVSNFNSARLAAEKLRAMGAQHVLITAGADGAYLFTGAIQKHLPIPDIQSSTVRDETGCGDQAMATLCAYLQAGKSVEAAAELAVISGTLQFHQRGIQPISKEELERAIRV